MNPEDQINQLIEIALQEDIRSGDLVSSLFIKKEVQAKAKMILKQAGIVAGLVFLEKIFKKVDPEISIELHVKEGSFQKAGTVLCSITGSLLSILQAERVALNIIQHASGVATITSQFVKKIAGLNCVVMDTRKTLPGLRALEKYCVKLAGGVNHRFGLDDRLILKQNHQAHLKNENKTSLIDAIKTIKTTYPDLPVEIEVEEFEKIDLSVIEQVDAVMLINMSSEDVKKSVKKLRPSRKKIYVEAGGSITIDTVRAYAETGVDGVSIGDLTHSVKALDIRMRLT